MLQQAAQSDDMDAVVYLLSRGADKHAKSAVRCEPPAAPPAAALWLRAR